MITVALCTRNRPHHCADWVTHMTHVINNNQHPILIIDQSDTAATDQWPPHVTYVHTPTRGLALARNLALQRCTTPYILFTDDDCRPAHDWLIRARECVDIDPAVAVWFGQTWPSGIDYTLHHYHTNAGQTTWASRSDGAVCHALRISEQPFRTHHPVAVLEHLGHGNQMLIRCDLLRHIGGFDQWLGAGSWLASGEDVDMTLRMLNLGYPCAFAPQLHIIHDAWVMPAEHAQRSRHYSTGMIALHMSHAWRGNQVAREYLYFRLKEARYALTPAAHQSLTKPISRWWHIIAVIHGIIGGIGLIIRGRSA